MRFRFTRKQKARLHHDSVIEEVTPEAQPRRWRVRGANGPIAVHQRPQEEADNVVKRYAYWQGLQPQDTIARRVKDQEAQ